MAYVGVFPVSQETFKIGSKGMTSTLPTDMVGIKELTELGLDIDTKSEEWTSIESGGWQSALVTGKGFKLSFKAMRSVGDAGNDFIANTWMKIGSDCYAPFEWTFPDGKLTGTIAIALKKGPGGKATDVAAIEGELLSHGKPTWTPTV